MPSRERIIEALVEHKRVDAAAESLGLGVRRMYRWMERYGLTLKDVLWRSAISAVGGGDETAPAASESEPAVAATERARDVRRLTARDFSGPCLGEVGKPRNRPGSVDELLERYHRLRNR